ncbi:hypothetical protein BGZ83_000618 [Gryganskiella cystojenkinii]|nr:hypothetical protein BGZ83_000618 [Gryganskiella cystojenkinii]
MLKRIQEHPIELADIIRLLVTKKAILILPTCAISTEDQTPPTRAYFEDHVIIPESNHGESLFVTLSGMRGILKPTSSSITMLGATSGQDFETMVSDASGPTKRSFFDNLSKSVEGLNNDEGKDGGPASHSELKLVNSSKRPVVIFVESVGSVHALLLDHAVVRPEGDVAPTPIVPPTLTSTSTSSLMDRAVARRTASSASSVRSASLYEDTGDLPKLPKIATDLPLEWDAMVRSLESLVVKLRKNPLPNPDRYANELQRKYDEVRERFEVYGSASGMNHRWSEQDFDETQQWVEAWLCRELYQTIFAKPGSVDFLQDEQLQAKIAALNFLDLTLEHLGFVLEHPEDVVHIAEVVREGGVEMQKLASVKSPTDKMNVILSSHRVVVDALSREPAVQELLAETEEHNKESSGASETVSNTTMTDTESKKNKRRSMPKILMDGVIPRANSGVSLPEARSPRIMMDEGFERPFALDKKDEEKDNATVTREEKKDDKKDESVPNAETNEGTVDPASVELPKSPSQDEDAAARLVESEAAKESTDKEVADEKSVDEETTTALSAELSSASEEPIPLASSRKQYSADVLLPLLIFSVVKSNPPMLISNLRYIQRFKVQDQLSGELAYCLTNMMAVVSFLETLDPQTLGLSNDIRVLSDISDIQVNTGKPAPPTTPLIAFQEGFDQTRALGHKVSQDIVGVAEEGIKAISDVVQDGYSKFFGRLTNSSPGGGMLGRNNNISSNSLSNGKRSMSAASSLAATAAVVNAASTSTDPASGMITPALLTKNVSTVSVDSKSGENSSSQDFAEKHRIPELLRASAGPQIQFMACTNYKDLRISDVKSLLEDYQRIGKLLEEMKRQA